MSRKLPYWRVIVECMLRNYEEVQNGRSAQERRYTEAVRAALRELDAMPDGQARMRIIENSCLKKNGPPLTRKEAEVKRQFVNRVAELIGW